MSEINNQIDSIVKKIFGEDFWKYKNYFSDTNNNYKIIINDNVAVEMDIYLTNKDNKEEFLIIVTKNIGTKGTGMPYHGIFGFQEAKAHVFRILNDNSK